MEVPPPPPTNDVPPDVAMGDTSSASSTMSADSWKFAESGGEQQRGRTGKAKGKRGKAGFTPLQAKREAARRASSLGLRKVRTPDKATSQSTIEDVRERPMPIHDAGFAPAPASVPVPISPAETQPEDAAAGMVQKLKEEIEAPIADWMGRTVSAEECARHANMTAEIATSAANSAGARAETDCRSTRRTSCIGGTERGRTSIDN